MISQHNMVQDCLHVMHLELAKVVLYISGCSYTSVFSKRVSSTCLVWRSFQTCVICVISSSADTICSFNGNTACSISHLSMKLECPSLILDGPPPEGPSVVTHCPHNYFKIAIKGWGSVKTIVSCGTEVGHIVREHFIIEIFLVHRIAGCVLQMSKEDMCFHLY